jgi:lipopolysaccharide transport system ATP-binding protein
MPDIAIRVEDLGKQYRISAKRTSRRTFAEAIAGAAAAPFRSLRRLLRTADASCRESDSTVWALRHLTFEISRGEVVGVVGHNGAGKSTLLKILSRITSPTEGSAVIYGRVGSLLEVGIGFHSELTGRDNVFLSGAILGMTRREIARRFDEIVSFAEVDRFIDTPVKFYSSGMYLRLAFAVAAHLEPDILIVDEVLAVGDVNFQRKCLGKVDDVAKEGRTVLFVSHNMQAVQRLCPRSLLLQRGQLLADSNTADIVAKYLAHSSHEISPESWIDVSGIHRRGTGQIIVAQVWYSGLDSSVSFRPRSRGQLELRLVLVSSVTRSIGSIAITIYDKNGTKLVNADLMSLGKSVRISEGRNALRFTINDLFLNPGRYVLGWWISDLQGTVFDFVEAAADIEVIGVDSLGFGIRPSSDGLVCCDFAVEVLPE